MLLQARGRSIATQGVIQKYRRSYLTIVARRLFNRQILGSLRPINILKSGRDALHSRHGERAFATVLGSESASSGLATNRTTRYPSVLQEVADNMEKYPGCVILTKVGGFYELYFEQATELGALLNLKVAERKYVGGKVPMSGFPFFQLDRYLKILVQDLNKHVAISEEFPRSVTGKVKSGGLLFERRVARIVTPGTLVDEKFMQPAENNFLLAINAADTLQVEDPSNQQIGLAWMDLSTDLLRIGPREVVLNESMQSSTRQLLLQTFERDSTTLTYFSKPLQLTTIDDWKSRLESPIIDSEKSKFCQQEINAGCVLLEYAKEQLFDLGMKLQAPVKRIESENVSIDKNTMRGLEILERTQTTSTGGKGSLLHAMRRTVTKSGSRLLRERICSPSTSLTVINQRLDLVECLMSEPILREKLTGLLEETFDSQRIAQKFTLGKGDADDLISLHRTIMATGGISRLAQPFSEALNPHLNDSLLAQLSNLHLERPLQLAQNIAYAIDEDALLAHHLQEMRDKAEVMSKAHDVLTAVGNEHEAKVVASKAKARGLKLTNPTETPDEEKDRELDNVEADMEAAQNILNTTAMADTEHPTDDSTKESWMMRRTASPTLQTLHQDLENLYTKKANLTEDLRILSQAASLSLRWTPGLGYHVHVKGVKDIRNAVERLSSARSVGSSKSTRTFYIGDWSKLGTQLDQVKLQIRSEEQRVFQTLRDEVIVNLAALRRNAMILDELDVASSFAILSSEQKLTRPILNNGRNHKIVDGRHPTVMLGLEEQGRSFVSNDCLVGDEERIWLITGPNMAGKSTFLRQNALISILAQVGCFVPAKYAEIGIVDQIFSRIGSADNLYQDQSTFMIEMLETANILHKATPRSFVIMDEIGRGTTPEDGIAVGYACLHHLYHVNKCRTLFATHFHKLCDMTASWSKLANYCTDVREESNGAFSYIHRLRPGINRESHALKVAQLAGIPIQALKVAADVKASLLVSESDHVVKPDERSISRAIASG